jgi:hypothetical protein
VGEDALHEKMRSKLAESVGETIPLSGAGLIADAQVKMPTNEADEAVSAPVIRYVESIVAGIKIKAHPDFRLVATMNDDASTFELPEYIHSRLQPQILIDFPERDEEYQILKENLPFAEERILNYVTDFLQMAHAADERYTARDGINVARFAIKLKSLATQRTHETEADEIGLLYMARAGYDPRESISFWRRMAEAGGNQPPEFMSTHPSQGTRIERLQQFMPKAISEYEKSTKR